MQIQPSWTPKQINYYDLLSVRPNASDDDIKKAYRMLVKKIHTDYHPNNRKAAEYQLKIVNEAYSCLKSKTNRVIYNQHLKQYQKQLRRTKGLRANNDNKANRSPSMLVSMTRKILYLLKSSSNKSSQKS